MTFAAAAARLQGLLKGSFSGIEVLKRGVSPRIVAAEVLGSRGATPRQRPRTRRPARPDSTWAYFSVKNGAHVKREPDHSGQPAVHAERTRKPAARRSGAGARTRRRRTAARDAPARRHRRPAVPAPDSRFRLARTYDMRPSRRSGPSETLVKPRSTAYKSRMRTRSAAVVLACAVALLGPASAFGGQSSGTPGQIAWVRRAATTSSQRSSPATARARARSSTRRCGRPAGTARARSAGTRASSKLLHEPGARTRCAASVTRSRQRRSPSTETSPRSICRRR